ELDKWAG
nr:Chain C, GP41 PEPTIDE [Human immunodeficiency virus 1]